MRSNGGAAVYRRADMFGRELSAVAHRQMSEIRGPRAHAACHRSVAAAVRPVTRAAVPENAARPIFPSDPTTQLGHTAKHNSIATAGVPRPRARVRSILGHRSSGARVLVTWCHRVDRRPGDRLKSERGAGSGRLLGCGPLFACGWRRAQRRQNPVAGTSFKRLMSISRPHSRHMP